MRYRVWLRPLLGVLAASAAHIGAQAAHAQELPNYEAYYEAPRLTRAAPADASLPFGARLASTDTGRNVPTFVWAHRGRTPRSPYVTPVAAARWYLDAMSGTYRLSKAALDTAYVHHVHDTGRGGIIVTFRQTIGGLPVHMTALEVLLDRDLRLVAISGNLHEAASAELLTRGPKFQIDDGTAVARAVRDLYGLTATPQGIRDLSWTAAGYRHFDLAPGGDVERAGIRFTLPARVRAVYYPMPDRLVPAYFLEVFATHPMEEGEDVYSYVVAADTGQVLARRNLTFADVYQYRVWADTDGLMTPLDGPQDDYTPHPTGVPGLPEPAFIEPVLVAMEGFNASPTGAPDPWLPPGALETRGNNVDAYADHFAPQGFTAGQDRRAAITAPGVFDYVYDPLIEPMVNTTQVQAAVTQLFYANNWLHDYFYDSGFDEAAGNAQQDNFGRGGLGADALRAEGQDNGPNPGVRNNANMSVPADGAAPRMQMFLWNTPDIAHRFEAFGQEFEFNRAFFGPQEYVLAGPLALANDGSGAPGDACEPLQNVQGAVVLIDRGICTFASKAQRAQQAGAAAVIIANNVPGDPPPSMPNATPPLAIGIPTIGVTFENGAALKALLGGGSSEAALESDLDTERDGTIDNAIIAHEWGHYIHLRLVDCGSSQCSAQSEGWGDFMALHMMVREGDDYLGTYAMSIYATLRMGDNAYFGIRRAPYSSDPTRNSLSFRHISNGTPLPTEHPFRLNNRPNSEVHAAGEIWASMLFDGYVALLRETEGPEARYGFDEAKRRMADYVVAGMIMAPPDPTYTEQRDAILAAALALDEQDALLLADGFARRGAGSCAVAPPRNSNDFVGVVEDAAVRPAMRVAEIKLDDSLASCDGDGTLDADETGFLTITVDNPTPLPLAGTTLSLTTATPGVAFPAGDGLGLATVPPFGSATVEIPVTLGEPEGEVFQALDLALTLRNETTCETTLTRPALARGNFDIGPGQRDDAESLQTNWSEHDAVGAAGVWTRVESDQAPSTHLYHGDARGSVTDTSFVSPRLQVGTDEPFVVTFQHRYQFETGTSGGQPVFFDGGLIEISSDGGVTFRDVSTLAKPGYTAALGGGATNPLVGRPAFAGTSPGYPAMQAVTLDFGQALAGNSVILRFRIGTDNGVGAAGWDIDTIQASGIVNQPFRAVVADQAPCTPNLAPVASAGPDLTVPGGSEVILDASGSSDPEGRDVAFTWTQSEGPAVALGDVRSAITSFVAPVVAVDTLLRFTVSVNDRALQGADTVDVLVLAPVLAAPDAGPGSPDAGAGAPDAGPGVPPDATPEPEPEPEPENPIDGVGGGGGCGCAVGEHHEASGSAPALLALGLLGVVLLRRRRSARP
ncbi:MAG TPA: M36 family metallopeptidase [Haliangium sp.]|nr:M36 family metallopeptidase [Haliangium sp.]